MRRADRAEARGQLALHRVARGLPGRGEQREHGPEPGGVEHGDVANRETQSRARWIEDVVHRQSTSPHGIMS